MRFYQYSHHQTLFILYPLSVFSVSSVVKI
jgi:hypothetical protein